LWDKSFDDVRSLRLLEIEADALFAPVVLLKPPLCPALIKGRHEINRHAASSTLLISPISTSCASNWRSDVTEVEDANAERTDGFVEVTMFFPPISSDARENSRVH
jgi:hypothetical protein